MSNTKGMRYDIDANGLTGVEGYAQAIVQQAVDDWRWLCEGNKETPWCNFDELKYFFKHESGIFIRSENGTEQLLWEQMQEERRLSGY